MSKNSLIFDSVTKKIGTTITNIKKNFVRRRVAYIHKNSNEWDRNRGKGKRSLDEILKRLR